jgi:hypothetical protein
MAPPVRGTAMADGGRAAFHVLGRGPAVAMLFPYHVNHLTLNWRVPLHRGAIEFLARHFTIINLDFRGAGLSDPLIRELAGLAERRPGRGARHGWCRGCRLVRDGRGRFGRLPLRLSDAAPGNEFRGDKVPAVAQVRQ